MSGPLKQVGIITAAHGIRGEVKIRCLIAEPELLFSAIPVTDGAARKRFVLTRRGTTDKLLIASIEGVKDRNAAELLKGTKLYLPEDSIPESGGWYYDELIGLKAVLKNGQTYGRVIGVHNYGAGDIIEIERMDGSAEMLPLNDDFIGDVEPSKGFLIALPPEYLEADDEQE